jgi:hypothetical protein
VLLAAEGRSTRSIAEEVGVQPRIVSNCAALISQTALSFSFQFRIILEIFRKGMLKFSPRSSSSLATRSMYLSLVTGILCCFI